MENSLLTLYEENFIETGSWRLLRSARTTTLREHSVCDLCDGHVKNSKRGDQPILGTCQRIRLPGTAQQAPGSSFNKIFFVQLNQKLIIGVKYNVNNEFSI